MTDRVYYPDIEQGSPEWFALKAGKFSGSRFKVLMSKTASGKPTAGRANLLADLAIERITGIYTETYCSAAMQRGIEREPEILAAYEDHNLLCVDTIGFIQHAELPFIGVSPDALVGDGGMAQYKFRSASDQHLKCVLHNHHATEYKYQLQGEMWIAQRDWSDVVSYDPRFPDGVRLAIARVERDTELIEELKAECIKANKDVDAIVEQLNEKIRKAA